MIAGDEVPVVLVLSTSTGGIGRHVRDLARGLVAADAEVTVCGPRATDDLFDFAGTGARFVPVEDARSYAVLRREVAPAGLVHAHGLRAGLLGGVALGRRRTPYVVTRHNAILAGRLLGRTVERKVARRADVTLAVSSDLVGRVRALGGRDVRLAPVGADPLPPPTRSATAVREELGAADRPLVLAIGRLHPQKGFDVLVRAAAGWAGHRPALRTVVAGEGPDRDHLDGLIRSTGADMWLLGRRDDVADLLAAADVVVMPSRWEGSPLAAHETLHAGRPLVATAVGGLPDLLGDGAAVLVPPEDPDALRHAVVALLEDPSYARSVAVAGHERSAAWPDATTTVARILAVYDELLAAR